MRYLTFLRKGVEVLELGMQNAESNAWPPEHWRENKGRWRLYTPAIDTHLNQGLLGHSFGTSVEYFVLLLEIADFTSWGPTAFAPPEGRVTYKPSRKELWSVGQLNWLQIQHLTPSQQLREYQQAAIAAIGRISAARRKPKDFAAPEFSNAVATLLESAQVSTLTRAAQRARIDA